MSSYDKIDVKLFSLENVLDNWGHSLAEGHLRSDLGRKFLKVNNLISEIAGQAGISEQGMEIVGTQLIKLTGLQSRFDHLLTETADELMDNRQLLPADAQQLRLTTIRNIAHECLLYGSDENASKLYRGIMDRCDEYFETTELVQAFELSYRLNSAASGSSSSQSAPLAPALQVAPAAASSAPRPAVSERLVLIKNEYVTTANYLYQVGKVVSESVIRERGTDVDYKIVTLLPGIAKPGELPNQRVTIRADKTYLLDADMPIEMAAVYSEEDLAGLAAYVEDFEKIINVIDSQADLHSAARVNQHCHVHGFETFAELKAGLSALPATAGETIALCTQLAAYTTQAHQYAKTLREYTRALESLTIQSSVLGNEELSGDLDMMDDLIIQPFLERIDRHVNTLAEHLSQQLGCPQT